LKVIAAAQGGMFEFVPFQMVKDEEWFNLFKNSSRNHKPKKVKTPPSGGEFKSWSSGQVYERKCFDFERWCILPTEITRNWLKTMVQGL
jgi:hypothetical protein